MSWYFSTAVENKSDFFEFFEFNQFEVHLVELWDSLVDVFGVHKIPHNLMESSNTKLVIDASEFISLFESDTDSLTTFLQTNRVVIYQDIDCFVGLTKRLRIAFENIDSKIPKNCLHVVFDAVPSTEFYFYSFKNINFTVLTYNHFFKLPRIHKASLEKNKTSKEFLLTTIKKSSRPHRKLLWKQLQAYPELTVNSTILYKTRQEKWVGHQTHQHQWNDGHPSMDLYLNNYIELVPETLYKHGFFFTEKTLKPIATKTPFLIVSNCHYLKFLKQQGFKTFDNLIDESYDSFPRIEDRIKSVVQTMHDISKNGAGDFYKQAQHTLAHNHQRLLEISGGWRYYRDLDYQRIIDSMC